MAELFSGIGGWSEAAKMAGGITPVWCSEIHKYKNLIYEIRHPGVQNLGDIRNIESPPHTPIFSPYHSHVLESRLLEKVRDLRIRIAGFGLTPKGLLGSRIIANSD